MKIPLPSIGIELPRRSRKGMSVPKKVIPYEGYLTIGETENWKADDLMRYFFGRPLRRSVDKKLDIFG